MPFSRTDSIASMPSYSSTCARNPNTKGGRIQQGKGGNVQPCTATIGAMPLAARQLGQRPLATKRTMVTPPFIRSSTTCVKPSPSRATSTSGTPVLCTTNQSVILPYTANCIIIAHFLLKTTEQGQSAESPLKTRGKVQILGDYYAIRSISHPQRVRGPSLSLQARRFLWETEPHGVFQACNTHG